MLVHERVRAQFRDSVWRYSPWANTSEAWKIKSLDDSLPKIVKRYLVPAIKNVGEIEALHQPSARAAAFSATAYNISKDKRTVLPKHVIDFISSSIALVGNKEERNARARYVAEEFYDTLNALADHQLGYDQGDVFAGFHV